MTTLRKKKTPTKRDNNLNRELALTLVPKTPIGAIWVVASPKGLVSVTLEQPQNQLLQLANYKDLTELKKQKKLSTAQQHLLKSAQQLAEYFQNKRQQFDLNLDLSGTDFQVAVWKKLLTLPFSKSLTYSDLALKVKRPRAQRAVGSAVGKNPLLIIVPCHRVLASKGKLGGFSGGLDVKRALLKLENISYSN